MKKKRLADSYPSFREVTASPLPSSTSGCLSVLSSLSVSDTLQSSVLEEFQLSSNLYKKKQKCIDSTKSSQFVCRLIQNSEHSTRLGSLLLEPVRTIGLITDGNAFFLSTGGDIPHLLTSAGNEYLMYDTKSLRVAFRSTFLPLQSLAKFPVIGAIGMNAITQDVYVASGNQILLCHRLRLMGRLCCHRNPINGILILGDYLFSYSENELLMWNFEGRNRNKNESVIAKTSNRTKVPKGISSRAFPIPPTHRITTIVHPDTYINKILLGFSDGALEIWNFRTARHVYTLSCHHMTGSDSSGSENPNVNSSSITCIAKSSHPDILAAGQVCGRIIVFNARQDHLLLEFFQNGNLDAITALSFSYEKIMQEQCSLLVSGSSSGSFVVWNLDKGIMLTSCIAAHKGSISFLSFLPGQPVMLSAGTDNTIIMWIFDPCSGSFRILKERRGHAGSITQMAFYDEANGGLLTSSNINNCGYLGITSTTHLHQNYFFSSRDIRRQNIMSSRKCVPPIKSIAFAYSRHMDWPNVISCHKGVHEVYMWNALSKEIDPFCLSVSNERHLVATAVAASHCGNFVVVGYENGALHRFSMQSSVHHGSFLRNSKCSGKAHFPSVCGLSIFGSRFVLSVSSHSEDTNLLQWNLITRKLEHVICIPQQGYGISALEAHADFAAVAFQNGVVNICDISIRRVVRDFDCRSPTCSMCFSANGRWLVVATVKCELFIFDLYSSMLIDWLLFPSPVLSCSFDRNGMLLYTAFHHSKGVLAWSWISEFDESLSLPLLKTPSFPSSFDAAFNIINLQLSSYCFKESSEIHPYYSSFTSSSKPLFAGAFTLSGMPLGKMQSILHLELIKQKSQPLKNSKISAVAPFFLPNRFEFSLFPDEIKKQAKSTKYSFSDTLENSELKIISPEEEKLDEKVELQKLLVTPTMQGTAVKYNDILMYLANLSPSGVFLAMNALGEMAGGNNEELLEMLRCFVYHVEKRHWLDFLHPCLQIFLQLHGETLICKFSQSIQNDELIRLQLAIYSDWNQLDLQMHQMTGFLKFLTRLQI
ncbi:WD domain, G-beta repeat-containing protein [Cardiosporidium cionae]|uniref:WD domain, G-beta repeat-containing protein n=1 Tax=Cardiosporidium cionae TaxID=476202 RepID=A0ABQ7J6S4_9APIC|nr:WD domain, G-beta repeat-containing protein [Cardiosporidium cionae]|eukprot:KAF8819675.1 WD domain, G-beta repeat-containing protein [Cardiosporidium cionae]